MLVGGQPTLQLFHVSMLVGVLVQVGELAEALKVLEKMMDIGTLTNGL